MSDTRKILCTKCNKPAEAVTSPNTDTRISCSGCGREEDLNKAIAAAAKYQVSNMLGASLGKIRSKHITVKRSPNPKPDFVFE